jgi:hypothetical protein
LASLAITILLTSGWQDSLLNASLIQSGMGRLTKNELRLQRFFTSFYALFSGATFLTTVAVFLTLIAQRLMDALHVYEDELVNGS